MNSRLLKDLQTWYVAQCDGDWEHTFGIQIGTLDNPGWMVKINLEETILENKPFDEVEDLEPKDDWIHCKVENKQFMGYGGPHKLTQLLEIFLRWAKTEENWLAIPPPPTQEEKDKEFYAMLGEETGVEFCKREGCKRKRIEGSVMCRIHHFEMIKGYLPSFVGEG